MSSMQGKRLAVIYVTGTASSTKKLTNFISKYIDSISIKFHIKFVRVTKKNVAEIKRKGIEETPTLVVAGRMISGVRDIVKLFEPCLKLKHGFSKGITNSSDEIHKYQMSMLNAVDNEDDDDENDPDRRGEVIRKKMAALQKRRPEMRGADKTNVIPGGRKLKPTSKVKSSFLSDADFIASAGSDNIEETPFRSNFEEADGDLILEDYYLDLALEGGKKTKPGRRKVNY